MAPKKPKDIKETTADDASAVVRAARRLLGKERSLADTLLDGGMNTTQSQVDDMDKQFQDEEVKVRVLQHNPHTGELTDVSDKINPRDIRPEDIASMRSDTMAIPMGKDGKIDKEAAKALLAQIMGGSGYRPSQTSTSTTAMQRMEVTLAKSDEILRHFKE